MSYVSWHTLASATTEYGMEIITLASPAEQSRNRLSRANSPGTQYSVNNGWIDGQNNPAVLCMTKKPAM